VSTEVERLRHELKDAWAATYSADAEVERLREDRDLWRNGALDLQGQVGALRAALETISHATLNLMPPHCVDVLNAPDIARQALSQQTEEPVDRMSAIRNGVEGVWVWHPGSQQTEEVR
jgi:hypothetical protein